MGLVWQDDHLTLYGGDCRDVLKEIPAESVHCVVTSPPYWGLRDYGEAGQLGLEPTPEAYVANMVAVFREVRRVLRKDGTLWLNLGDSYARDGGAVTKPGATATTGNTLANVDTRDAAKAGDIGLKPKDLVGIPWRVAFALQADGWYLRSDIIWAKPNPMPESVTDRPTKAHEYLFLLTKSPRYYYDAEAVREAFTDERMGNPGGGTRAYAIGDRNDATDSRMPTRDKGAERGGRNLRSVWTIATEPYPGAHFATFPRKLVEPCVKAGTSERGVCPECGAPWVRETTVAGRIQAHWEGTEQVHAKAAKGKHGATSVIETGSYAVRETTGWSPSCTHDAEPVPAVVLDPFAGSGTTLLVAQSLGRRGIGIDLSPDYLKQALLRNKQTPLGLIG